MDEFCWSVDKIRLIQAPSIPADWTGLVIDVPHLNAGSAVGVCAGQDKVGPALKADATLLQ
jgi:hypothetical protein